MYGDLKKKKKRKVKRCRYQSKNELNEQDVDENKKLFCKVLTRMNG